MSRRRRKTKPKKCQCTNHMGTSKQQFSTKDAALIAIIRNHLWTGKGFSTYQCPTSDKWHVTSKPML